jgi:ribosomal RNA assembly protein
MIESVLIPRDRLGVIKNRETKGEVEKKLNVKITFEDNAVLIDGEALEFYKAKNIVKAIGRGFSPPKAFRLFDDEEVLEVIKLEFTDKKNDTIKSRVIGTSGSMREEIETCTKASVSVYGKTIALIGTYEQIKNAKEAVGMLINGAMHKTVYDFLRRL